MQHDPDEQEIETAFGQAMRDARLRLNLSQRSLAALLEERGVKIDASAITRIEKKGGRGLRFFEAAAIATVLEIDLGELVEDFADPQASLLFKRHNAQQSLTRARRAVSDALYVVRDVKEMLDRHPDLEIWSEEDRPTTPSSDRYLDWVVSQIDRWPEDVNGPAIDDEVSAADKAGYRAIAQAIVDNAFLWPKDGKDLA